MKLFHPKDRFIQQWNKTFLLCSVVSLSLDPLFFYIPVVDGTQKCLDINRNMSIVLSVLRSFVDIFYVFHIIINFRTMIITPNREYIGDPKYVAKRYLTSNFIIDVLAALPLPQFAVLKISRNVYGPNSMSKDSLIKIIMISLYVPRVIQAILFYTKVTKDSVFFIKKAWAGAAFNLFLYVLASHVVGALWYLFAIASELRCFHIACKRYTCHSKYLYCEEGRVEDYGFLNSSCPLLERSEIKDSTDFDFGLFLDALQTRVTETRDFIPKYMYCSWWGLQSLSSLGQGLKASTFYGEILFADFITLTGLVLLALLIGNMQRYLQSYSNKTLRLAEKMEEMKEKTRECENLMSYMSLPEELRQRVRRHKDYQWKTRRCVELDPFVKDLPRDLRRDIRRHVCLPLLKRVPMFEVMDDHLLDAISDRLKAVYYTEGSYFLREGDPAHEMLFVTHGRLECVTTNGGRSGCFTPIILMAGEFCGEELLAWALDPNTQQRPFSTTTFKALTDVQGFTLVAEDLLYIASQFRLSDSTHFQHIFRFYSPQWRAKAARYIQDAWRKWKHRKILKENKKLQDALATGSETSTLSLCASIYVSKFSSNALRILRRNHIYNAQVSTQPMMRQSIHLDDGQHMQIKTE